MSIRLIVGLGNPGKEYANTRHNVGFMIVDRMAQAAGVSFGFEKAWKGEVCRLGDACLLKPMTYMNLSGESVRSLQQFHKIAAAEILVVLDDMALPLGSIRLKQRGSAGGHNGLKSIIECLGTNDIPRLRVGIGTPRGCSEGSADPVGGAVGHVLGSFRSSEAADLADGLSRAAGAIECARVLGLSVAMNNYN
jgi:PTH1 family peptidyl-tRNA hydrolase